MVFYFIFFCAWLWLFRARLQATVAPKMPRGWDGGRIKNGFPKSPAGGFWFLQHARVLGVSGKGREQAKDGNNAMSVL